MLNSTVFPKPYTHTPTHTGISQRRAPQIIGFLRGLHDWRHCNASRAVSWYKIEKTRVQEDPETLYKIPVVVYGPFWTLQILHDFHSDFGAIQNR
jgi:hypothetical protein